MPNMQRPEIVIERVVEERIFYVEVYGRVFARANEDGLLHRFAWCFGTGFGGWAVHDLLLDVRERRTGSRWTGKGGEIYQIW